MKIIFNTFVIAVALFFFNACTNETMINPDPSFVVSFQRDGRTTAALGKPFYVIPKGSGQFLTLYSGDAGQVWGQDGAQGTAFNGADSLVVNYTKPGKYILTLVSTSTGNFGKDYKREIKTLEITVVDERNTILSFSVNIAGKVIPATINAQNVITIPIPDVTTSFNFTPTFILNSDSAKVFVNGIVQTSAVTTNDFTQPVIYTVRSLQGADRQYTVQYSKYSSSSAKMLTQLALSNVKDKSYGEIATIDESTKTINLITNYGTNLSAVNLNMSSSPSSRVFVNGREYNYALAARTNYNLLTTSSISVMAEDNSQVIYTLKVLSQNPVISFSFAGLVPSPTAVIDDVAKTITINVLKGTDITKLVANWIGTLGQVSIGTVPQINGTTVNDFTQPQVYTFYKGTTATDNYTVSVNVR